MEGTFFLMNETVLNMARKQSGSGRRNVREDASGNFIDGHGLQDDPSGTLHHGIENPFSAEQHAAEHFCGEILRDTA